MARLASMSLAVAVAVCVSGCDQSGGDAEPTPVEKAKAEVPVSDAVAEAPAVLTAVDLRRVCRAGLAAIHGQTLDAIELTGAEGDALNAQWRAPVDGGIMKAQCRAGDGLVAWKPLDLPDPASIRWINQSGDPVVRYAIRGEEIEITQTLPDGTSEATMMVVSAAGDSG